MPRFASTSPLLRSLALLALALPALPASAQGNARGLDPRNLDTATPACRDFYQHANGGWLKAHPVPVGLGSWGLFDEMQQRNIGQLRALLEAAAASPADPLDRLLGDFWASGMDEAAIESAGARPLTPLLQRIERLKKPKDLAAVLAGLHALGLPVLFDFGVADDLRDPSRRIAYANQGGLGLPDRDYYLRDDPDTRALLAAYRAYVERLLTLTGSSAAASEAGHVLEIETRLARASLSLLQLRDPGNSYRPVTLRQVGKLYPALDWKRFLKAQQLAATSQISLAHDSFFVEVEALAKTLPPEQWRAYLRFHVAHALAPYLSRGYEEAHEALFLRTLRGIQEPLPRWRRVLATTELMLGPALGERFAASHFPPQSRDAARTLVTAIGTALRNQIETAAWLGTDARTAALAKLDALDLRLGAPEQAPDYGELALDRSDYAGNVLAVIAFRHRRAMQLIGAVGDAGPWPQPAHAVNAYYDPGRNQLVLPAGFLQPPLFDPAADAAINHGALGALVAQQLMHGFDVLGATYAADGRIAPWWSAADANGFASRTRPLEAQYDAYTALGPIKVSGRLTLAENIADLAGIETAWKAFVSGDPGSAKVDGHTPQQRFFLAWAQVWRRNYRDEELTVLLQTDVQAPAKFRVNGPLANFTPFSETFACKAGRNSFVRNTSERVTVW